MPGRVPYPKSDVPLGSSGAWTVENFDVPPSPFDESFDIRPAWARIPPGRYTRLRLNNQPFMTDTMDEWWTHKPVIEEARRRGGQILITGLGLGLVIESILTDPASNVQKITVIELSADVIHLVAPHLLSRYPERLEIIHGDAFTWQPPEGARYTVIWHDIWPNPDAVENPLEIKRLSARFQDYCDWQAAWTIPR